MRPAVNAEDQRILAVRLPGDRLHQPTLNRRPVETLKVDPFGFAERRALGDRVVVVTERTPNLLGIISLPNLSGPGGRSQRDDNQRDGTRCQTKARDLEKTIRESEIVVTLVLHRNLVIKKWPRLTTIRCYAVDQRPTMLAGEEKDRAAVRRPARRARTSI